MLFTGLSSTAGRVCIVTLSLMVKKEVSVKKEISASTGSPLSIGPLIEAELRRQERSVTWLSRKIHCDRRNIYDIFHRDSIDSTLLFKISRVLGVDFFNLYSCRLKYTDNQQITPPDSDGLRPSA